MVSTFSVFIILYIVARAVVYLYFDIPNVQEGKWKSGFILLIISGNIRQLNWFYLHE